MDQGWTFHMLSESKSEKDKCHDITYTRNLKHDTHELTKEKQTNGLENKLLITMGKRWGGIKLEFRINRYT